jgi:kynurenine formamidase
MSERIIDLSLTAYHGMRGVEIQPATSTADAGYNTTNLKLYSHAGTHMDAPLHFVDGGATIDQWDLRKCVGPAQVIDLSHLPDNAPIEVADLADHADRIGPGARLLLRTDWDAHADRPDYRTRFPHVSVALAEWLVARGVWLVGVQSPSVATLQDKHVLSEVHKILLRGQVVIVEGLANLRELPDQVEFIALPLKIQGGDGSPVRAIAIERSGA